jgi:uncharacterized protein YuzE
MEAFYLEKEDRLILVSVKRARDTTIVKENNHIVIDYDKNGHPIMLEILDASVLFKIPKKTLKLFINGKLI